MKKLLKVFVIVFITMFTTNSFAQDDCGCNIALARNTQDEFESTNSSTFKETLRIIFSQSFEFWENGEWKNDKAIASGGSYGVYSGFFNASQSEGEKKAKFQEMKTYYSSNKDISQSDYKYYSQKIASGKAYDSWLDCKRICGEGDLMLLERTVSGNEIIVTLVWKHKNTTDKQKIVSIVTSNATQLEGGNLGKDTIIFGQNSYTGRFKRNVPTEDASIKVNVSEYATNPIIVPAIPIENPASNYPVGTIIASVLDWKRFCKINNQSEILDYTDKAKCKWAPADGRKVIGSTYGTIENEVPDLRGVFIRGLNDFEVPGVQGVNPQQSDPDPDMQGNKRVANSLQKDAVGKHSHPIGRSTEGDRGGLLGGNLDIKLGGTTPTENNSNAGNETRPTNKAVYYYIKIN